MVEINRGDSPDAIREKFKRKVIKGNEKPARIDGMAGGDPARGIEPEPVGTIWKQGFPLATDEDTAVAEAIKTAKDSGLGGKILGEPEIVSTDAHIEAGEFLVKIHFGKEPKNDLPTADA